MKLSCSPAIRRIVALVTCCLLFWAGGITADEKEPPKPLSIDVVIHGLNQLAEQYKKTETTAQKQVVAEKIRKAMALNVDGRIFKFTCKVKDVKKVPNRKDNVWEIQIAETAEFKKYHDQKFKIGEVKFTSPRILRAVMTAEQATKIGKDELMFVSGTTSYDRGASISLGGTSRGFKICSFMVTSIDIGGIVAKDYTCTFRDFKAKSPY